MSEAAFGEGSAILSAAMRVDDGVGRLGVGLLSGGGGGSSVASIDSGGGTSGGLMSIAGADHSSATIKPCANRLKLVPHHERGLSTVSMDFARTGWRRCKDVSKRLSMGINNGVQDLTKP